MKNHPILNNYTIIFLIESLVQNEDNSISYCIDESALIELVTTISREDYKTKKQFEKKIKNTIIELIQKKAEVIVTKLLIFQIITEID